MAQINSVTGTTGNDILDVHRGDMYQPGKLVVMASGSFADGVPPVANLRVNGQVVVAGVAVWATAWSGASQEITYSLPAGTVVNSVAVEYTNDIFHSTTEDRNLYINSITLNGVELPLATGVYTPEAHPVQAGERLMAWNGPTVFSGATVANAMAANTYTNSVTINGDAGLDTVIYGGRGLNYDTSFSGGTILVNSKVHDFGPDTLQNVERVLFDDKGWFGNESAASISQDGNNRTIDGGSGIDTVLFNGAKSDYSISRTSGGNYVITHGSEADVLVNVERLIFNDAHVALDINSNGGQAYRLYQAAFNRTPDLGGLGFQMSALDNGLHLAQVADNFLHSPEFQSTYGNLSNEAYVRLLYQNVLHREGEPDGVAFHTHNLDSGAIQRFDTLVSFSESPENQANVIGAIQAGMIYTL